MYNITITYFVFAMKFIHAEYLYYFEFQINY